MVENLRLIFAVDQNWAIGYKGDMLFKIDADLKRFRALTEGNVMIMGRKTLESLPNAQPLPNRTNIVLSRDQGYLIEGATVVHSISELLALLEEMESVRKQNRFVIGGGELVEQLLPYCNVAHITKIQYAAEEADTYIPNLDEMADWDSSAPSERHEHNRISYCYVDYVRNRT